MNFNEKSYYIFKDFVVKFMTITIFVTDIPDKFEMVNHLYSEINKWIYEENILDTKLKDLQIKIRIMKCCFYLEYLKTKKGKDFISNSLTHKLI